MQDKATVYLDNHQLICEGRWDINHLANLEFILKTIKLPSEKHITLNGSAITQMDSAGAWLLNDWLKQLEKDGYHVKRSGFSKQSETLLTIVEKRSVAPEDVPVAEQPSLLFRIGKMTADRFGEFISYLAFIGKLTTEALRVLRHPLSLRWQAFFSEIDKTGFKALPIIALLSFMIGVVLTYQMGIQLRNYGANVFIVDLLGMAVLREFGPLITAIMVAGRTGSAFTAQLGIMKINQEIDALTTLGITPAELLLLPKISGLFIALPLLTIWADIFGVYGGMVMANNMLSINFYDFLHRFQQQVPLRALLIGIGKAPVFALIISSIGCFQGMNVRNNADSIGKNTTKSVVLAIFFIIVADAVFSVIFSKLKL